MEFSFVKYNEASKEIWEQINKESNSSFLTSIEWINFQKSLGKNVELYLIINNQEFIGNFYIEIFNRKIAKYAYSPYGPVINFNKLGLENLKEIFSQIKKFQINFAKQNDLNCFRMDPLIEKTNLDTLRKLGYVNSMAPTQAKYVWEIDISKGEDELLAEMKKVARYNIKSSQKEGIEVIKATTKEQVEEFYKILRDTTKRHEFASFSLNYFLKQFENLNGNLMHLYLAKYNNQYVSGALVNVYNNTGYYSHGGSLKDKELQKFGASYLLHWSIIKDLKQMGITKYNMWGVVPEGVTHPMQGVSDFKRRFGGHEIDYVGGLDISASLKYYAQRLSEYYIYKKDRY